MTQAFNVDCMEYMKTLPDKAFDLAVVDPPYGDALDTHTHTHTHGGAWNRFGGRFDRYKSGRPCGRAMGGEVRKKIVAWDIAPKKEYFEELFRVSRNQIIWGGNYFALPPTRCFLVWRKVSISEDFSMAMCEYAWTSFNANAKWFECAPQGKMGRFHPTEKPVDLYRWIFRNYARQGDKILDTHLGSGTSRIAAYDLGLDFVGCEIDKEYFDKQEERFAAYAAQASLFVQ